MYLFQNGRIKERIKPINTQPRQRPREVARNARIKTKPKQK